MSIQPLFDNALFIRFWKERMRPYMVWSAACVLLLITLLIFIGNYINQDTLYYYDYAQRKSFPVFWLNNALFQFAILQGIILLLFGTFSAGKMAGIEKSSGTLDFHRSAPTSYLNQIIGLVFGAPILEWCLFLATLVVSIVMALIGHIDFLRYFFFYISLILSAVFLHSLAVLCSIYTNSKRYSAGGILIAMYLFSSWASMLSCIYHATPFPAYSDLYSLLVQQGSSFYYGNAEFTRHMHLFFGYVMPYLLLQIIIQMPLAILFFVGIKRRFEYGERPMWSKVQSASFLFLALFYFAGSIANPNSSRVIYLPLQAQIIAFWSVAFIFMLLITPSATPKQLAFIKGLHRARKLGTKYLSPDADRSSNWLWLIVLCFTVTALFIISFALYSRVALFKLGLLLAVGLGYVIFFCSILEYFYLSQYHQKKAILVVGLVILWILLPAFGFVSTAASPKYLQYFLAPSPFFGIGYLSAIVQNIRQYGQSEIQPLVFITISAMLAIIAALLARGQRLRLVKLIRKN